MEKFKETTEKVKKSLLSTVEACGELVGVALLFTAVALVAVGLGHVVHFADYLGAGIVVHYLLVSTEYALLVLDIAILLKRVWHHLNKED
jgi:hypothetical protein